MKYVKAIDMWAADTYAALEAGTLKIQRGQWVKCGNSRPSRFVTIMDSGSVWAIHPTVSVGRDSYQMKKFLDVVRYMRKRKSLYLK